MRVGDYYDHYWARTDWTPGLRTSELHPLLDRFLTGVNEVVDVGCGDGSSYGKRISSRVGHYRGFDVSRPAVETARQHGLDVALIDDAVTLPLEDASCDAVLMLEVLEHLFAPQDALVEALRVLRPRGKLLVTVPNAAYWRRRWELAGGVFHPYGDHLSLEQPWRDPHVRFFTAPSLSRLVNATGFVHVHLGGHNDRSPLADLPPRRLFGRLQRRSEAGPMYRRLSTARPSFFAVRLHVIARTP